MTRLSIPSFPSRALSFFPIAAAALAMTGCPVYGDRPQTATTSGGPCTEDGSGGLEAAVASGGCTCGDKDVPEVNEPLPGVDTTSVPRRGGTMRIHVDANMPSLNAIVHSDAWINRIATHHIYSCLVRQDPHDYTYGGDLATHWDVDESGTEWTFHLRDGVRWHDGELFDAEDVLFTFDAIMNEQNRTEHLRADFQNILDPINPYEMLDASTFRINLKKPDFTFLQGLHTLTILPEHVFSRGDFNTHPNLREPIGTGPYKFIHWNSEEIRLERFDDYWGRPGYLDTLLFRILTDRETAFLALKRGDIDFMTRIQPHHRTEGYTEEVAKDYNLTEYVPSQYAFWVYNTTLPVFADARTRRAMTYLMPIERVICEIYQCQGARTTGPFPKNHPAYDHDLEPYAWSPEKARKLLEAAGWTDTDGDGIRDKMIDGVKVPFSFTFLLTASSRTLEQQLTIVQSSARRAGVDIKLSKVDWSVFVERLRKHDFEAASLLWILRHENDPFGIFHSEGGQNYGQWKHDEADAIMKTAPTLLDDVSRNVLYKRLHQILHEEQPYSFIYTPVLPGLVSKKYSGVYTSDQFFQWYDIWLNDPSLPEVPPEERHPPHTGATPWDETRR